MTPWAVRVWWGSDRPPLSLRHQYLRIEERALRLIEWFATCDSWQSKPGTAELNEKTFDPVVVIAIEYNAAIRSNVTLLDL